MIEFKDVVKAYNDSIVVNHLNLSIDDGEFFVLVGESGSGKSTTLNMINKLIVPNSGEILINGENVNHFNAEQLRRSIGYVVQSTGLFPHMTVEQNIAIVPRLLKWDGQRARQRVEELIELVGLNVAHYIDKYPAELSGGEAQRIGVARALAADPPILLMDEPFGAVDPVNRNNLQNELLKIQQELAKTIVFVTHDISEALKMGDRIGVMKKGVLEAVDTPLALITANDNAIVKEFLGSDSIINILDAFNVADYMTEAAIQPDLLTIGQGNSLKDVLARMIEASVTELAVVDDQHHVKGMIHIQTILDVFSQGR